MECKKTIYCKIEGKAKRDSHKRGTPADDRTNGLKTVWYLGKQLVSPDRSFYYIDPVLENEAKAPLKAKVEVKRLYPK